MDSGTKGPSDLQKKDLRASRADSVAAWGRGWLRWEEVGVRICGFGLCGSGGDLLAPWSIVVYASFFDGCCDVVAAMVLPINTMPDHTELQAQDRFGGRRLGSDSLRI